MIDLRCKGCERKISICYHCKHIFKNNNLIFCVIDGRKCHHFCSVDCVPDFLDSVRKTIVIMR